MDRQHGIDLALEPRKRSDSVLRLALAEGPTATDLATIQGRDNLAQAIWLRLAVARGELAHLGHPQFGSRLHQLVGRLHSASTHALARAYVRQALREEARIARLGAVEVEPRAGDPAGLAIRLRVEPIGAEAALDLTFDLSLDDGAVTPG
ncbi:MAG: hypothetical protein AAF560_23220 [Acidobacteriota bacterium]